MPLFDITVSIEADSAAEAVGKIIYDSAGEPVTAIVAIQVMPPLKAKLGLAKGLAAAASGAVIQGGPFIGAGTAIGRSASSIGSF